jgi:hypothetical protein
MWCREVSRELSHRFQIGTLRGNWQTVKSPIFRTSLGHIQIRILARILIWVGMKGAHDVAQVSATCTLHDVPRVREAVCQREQRPDAPRLFRQDRWPVRPSP